MKQEEIDELRELANDIYENYRLADILPAAIERLAALETRNAVLEAAVAWHGFDELPDASKGCFEIKYLDGSLGAGKYIEADQKHFIQMLRHGNIRIKDAHNFAIGWRYPVGDLTNK